VANYSNAHENLPAASKNSDVTEFQRTESDLQLKHQVVKNTLAKLTSSGALRVKCNEGKAWIDPELWEASNAEDKENVAHAVFESCNKTVAIYDAKSAKKLAGYGLPDGFIAY